MLGLALFSPAPYLEVMRHLVEGLRGVGLLGAWHVPAKSSLFRARQRLGSEPLRVLFATTAKPMATEATPGAFWRGLRLLAVDGTCWDVADSEANEAAFGRPGSGRGAGRSAFPQVRMAALVEVGSHAVLDAELAGCRTGEVTLVGRLPRSCSPGQLVLADREFLGVPLWQAFTATGADLLWRVPANRVLPVVTQFRDGSWLSRIRASSGPARHEPVAVRVLAYRLKDQVGEGSDYTAWSPPCWTPDGIRPGNWPRSTANAGRSSPSSPRSRPINAAHASYSAAKHPRASGSRSGRISWSTMLCANSC